MKKWILRKNKGNTEIGKKFNLNPIVQQILFNRDIRSSEDAELFLFPKIESFMPIELMKDVEKGYYIVENAIKNNKKIYIYGDYDADGVMSTAILYKAISDLGGNADYYIPHREQEGYGLNTQAVEELNKRGCQTLITCDNGIASVEEVRLAKSYGIDVVIIDHHEAGDVIPEADAVIDPKQPQCKYPFKQMCAAGICFRFATGLYSYFHRECLMYDELLSLACVATFCDIVDLVGENRIIAKNGLMIINKSPENIGLKALINERSLLGREIGEFEIGFIIGPCINATGRLESAVQAVELFTTEDRDRAVEIAAHFNKLNEERKSITSAAAERADLYIKSSGRISESIYIIYDEEIHESIAGIVAGRIKEKYYHPTIVLTKGKDSVKGSGRSIEGYNMFEELSKCRDLFLRFGGHAMAAGLSIEEKNIESLRTRLNEACLLGEDDFVEIIRIDGNLSINDITYTLAKELEVLKPFGKENKEPLFGSKSVLVDSIKIFENKNTIRFSLKDDNTYRSITGICFGKLEEFREMIYENYDEYAARKIMSGVLRTANLKLDLVYSIDINEYNSNVSVQLRIKDFRIGA